MKANWFPVILFLVFIVVMMQPLPRQQKKTQPDSTTATADAWTGAGPYQIPLTETGAMIRYGRELIGNTSYYLGPKGTIARITNGMNCQNCHLDAGTKPWGNNFGAVASTYPKFRDRSGQVESIEKRVNDCLERSLNGATIPDSGREMRAIVAYIKWLGTGIQKGEKPKGTGIMQLNFLPRAADPAKGEKIYVSTCKSCHGKNGEGQMNADQTGYQYPPLWGTNSYNTGAGLFRLSRLAGYVKNNMPQPVNYHAPQLTDEEAWDVAAFINSQPRPTKNLSKDWPDISKKPFDHPFGPYADSFPERQHKLGPFGGIK